MPRSHRGTPAFWMLAPLDLVPETSGTTDWERGYDQAVQEVLDEVCERDPDMAEAIVRKYPAWHRIISDREHGAT